MIHSDNDFASVAYLRIKGARLEEKVATTIDVKPPPLLEDEYVTVYKAVSQSQQAHSITSQALIKSFSFLHPNASLIRSRQVGPWVSISNVQSPSEGSTLQDEVKTCFKLLIGSFARLQIHSVID